MISLKLYPEHCLVDTQSNRFKCIDLKTVLYYSKCILKNKPFLIPAIGGLCASCDCWSRLRGSQQKWSQPQPGKMTKCFGTKEKHFDIPFFNFQASRQGRQDDGAVQVS